MSVEYVNRKGKKYYLHVGKTKTGRPKYYFSMKDKGDLIDAIPDGYEIYENPNARVFLRKIKPRIISEQEKEIVENSIKKSTPLDYFFVEVKKNAIIVFLPNQDINSLTDVIQDFPMVAMRPNLKSVFNNILTYSPCMKFVLRDKEKRIFGTQRYCYLGAIDGWIDIGKPGALKKLVKKYIPHLGKDSYYELT
jgi:hypothetical protein